MKRISRHTTRMMAIAMVCISALSCGGHQGVESENGRLAILAQANQYLNSGMCEQAIEVLRPYYQSKYVDAEVRLTYASAHACKANFNFPAVLSAFKSAGGDIWSALVKAMYSNGSDNNLADYRTAIGYVLETSRVAGSLNAVDRSDDSNVYMIFMQAGAISSVLSVLGQATQATGKKTQSATTIPATTEEACAVQVAMATINDSFHALSNAGSLGSIGGSVTDLCSSSLCTNKDYIACISDGTNTLPAAGQALITAIDGQWQF